MVSDNGDRVSFLLSIVSVVVSIVDPVSAGLSEESLQLCITNDDVTTEMIKITSRRFLED